MNGGAGTACLQIQAASELRESAWVVTGSEGGKETLPHLEPSPN